MNAPLRYQIKTLTDKGKLIGYVVYDHMTRDEFYTCTITPKIDLEMALKRAREVCAGLNNPQIDQE